MSKVSTELKLAKEKADAFRSEEQNKKDALTKEINNLKNSMDDFCKKFTDELQKQASSFESMYIHASSVGSERYATPHTLSCRWAVQYEEFENGNIHATMKNADEIRLFGGCRKRIRCSRKDNNWNFVETPNSVTEPEPTSEKIVELATMADAAEVMLVEAIFAMGETASRR